MMIGMAFAMWSIHVSNGFTASSTYKNLPINDERGKNIMKTKKSLAMSLLVITALSTAACGGKNNGTPASGDSSTPRVETSLSEYDQLKADIANLEQANAQLNEEIAVIDRNIEATRQQADQALNSHDGTDVAVTVNAVDRFNALQAEVNGHLAEKQELENQIFLNDQQISLKSKQVRLIDLNNEIEILQNSVDYQTGDFKVSEMLIKKQEEAAALQLAIDDFFR